MSERGLYYGIMASLVVGLPIFAYGNLHNNIPLILTGSILTICTSGIMARTMKDKPSADRNMNLY